MRKKLLSGLAMMLGLSISSTLHAQESSFSCATSKVMEKMYKEDPQLKLDQEALMNAYLEHNFENGVKRTKIVIPIVFHILHEYGTENITDDQVYDQMRILNEDFNKKNKDTSAIVPSFRKIAANCDIEFRLATKDPLGNCTNGINHIYSSLTNYGDDIAKLNQWQRTKYMNVWVINRMAPSHASAAGYAYYPNGVTGNGYFRDGIILIHRYIGSIGTANPALSRALTHEIGHYLGLPHVWGNNNDANVVCGDDGVTDTPVTMGHTSCQLNTQKCEAGVIENAQNYMDYSYCSNMFTIGQNNLMRYNLENSASGRNNLYTSENRIVTGTMYDVIDPFVCAPKPEFNNVLKTVCLGESVQFKDFSTNGKVEKYLWTFNEPNKATDTVKNPVVVYNTPGWKDVTLTVTNKAGSNSYTMKNAVYVSPNYTEVYGPSSQDFDKGADYWFAQNNGNNFAQFEKVSGMGISKSNCYRLRNFNPSVGTTGNLDDQLYYERLVLEKDNLITNSFDLSSTTNTSITFDYAYGTNATVDTLIKESLSLYVSKNCGKTWTKLTTLSGTQLTTSGYVGNSDFVPTSNSQWKTATVNFNASAADKNVRFRFEFASSNTANNLYIDNFNIKGTLAVTDLDGFLPGVSISPNPIQAGSLLNVKVEEMTQDLTLQLVDVNGALISTTVVKSNNGTQTIELPMNVAKGCYLIHAISGNTKSTHRVVVF